MQTPMNIRNARRDERQRGLTLVETALALSILTVMALAVSLTLLRGEEHRRQSFERYRALEAMRDFIADMQETANLPQNLSTQQGIGAIYAKYNGNTFSVPQLPNGQIRVTCYPDETSVPAELGGPQDLNFDGDAGDNHGGQANGSDLKLVPMKVTLTYTDGGVQQTEVLDRLLSKTTD